MDLQTFAAKMRQYIKNKGCTQAWVARRLGYSRGAVNKWVHGVNRMPAEAIKAFCRLLGLTEDAQIELLSLAGWVVEPTTLSYATSAINQMLVDEFEAQELWVFCSRVDFLKPVCAQVRRDAPINYLASRVVQFCKEDSLARLITAVRHEKGSRVQRYESHFFIPEGHLVGPSIYEEEDGEDPASVIEKLLEWKSVHSESQKLFDSVSVPLGLMDLCRLRAPGADPKHVGFLWRSHCVPSLRRVPDKWNLKLVYHPILDELREQTSDLDDITDQLLAIDCVGNEFYHLHRRVSRIKEVVWDALTRADLNITRLACLLKESRRDAIRG